MGGANPTGPFTSIHSQEPKVPTVYSPTVQYQDGITVNTSTTYTGPTCATGFFDEDYICTEPPPPYDPGGNKPEDPHLNPDCPLASLGMCRPNVSLMTTSLNINDTPVGYKPQKGPDVYVRLSYNHLDTVQPSSPSYSNLGPRWTHNFLSYIQDDPSLTWRTSRYVPGGGMVDYLRDTDGYVPGASGLPGKWGPEAQSGAILKRYKSGSTVTKYELVFPDGTLQTFDTFDGASTYPRRVFLSSIADPQGNAITLTYDGSLRLTTITDAQGRDTDFSYTGASLLIDSITDPFGRAATLGYGSGQLTSITDVIGITSSFTYDTGMGGDPYFISQLTTPYGNTVFNGGNDLSTEERWLEITDPEGFTERVEYLPSAAPGISATESSTPTGMDVENGLYDQRNTFYWDKEVYPTYGTGMGKDYTKAAITHWTIQGGGETSAIISSVKKPLENRVYFQYEAEGAGQTPHYRSYSGRPVKIGRLLDGGATQLTTIEYNDQGNVTLITDPEGRKTQFNYASGGINLTTLKQMTTAPSTFTTLETYTWNSIHRPLTYKTASNDTWTYTYNAAGQLLTVTDPGSDVTTYAYDGSARLDTITNDNSAVIWDFSYPSCGGSDNCDLPDTITDSEGRTLTYAYDALDRVTSITYPDSTTELFDYVAPGATGKDLDLWSHTDRLGRVTSYDYDDNRRLVQLTDPETNTVAYEYYGNGRLKKLTDGNGNETLWTVDEQGRPTLKTFEDTTETAYAYESSGRLDTVTDELGQVKTYDYNKADELTSIGYTNEVVSTPDVTFAWDTFYPRHTSMVDGIGTTTWSYIAPATNGALEVNTENGPNSNDSAVYTYDNNGRVSTMTVGGTTAESFTYDNVNRMATHTTLLGVFTMAGYSAQTSKPTSRTLASSSVTRAWSYGTAANDKRLETLTGTNSAARNLQLLWDIPMSAQDSPYHVSDSIETNGTTAHTWTASLPSWAYTYDDTERLLTAGDGTTTYTFAYDAAGNPTTFTGTAGGSSPTYGTVNELTSGSNTYDALGNLTADGTRTYTWDAENRLKTITQGSNVTTLTYDGLGRRIQSAFYDGMTTTTERYQWCETELCAKRDGSDVVSSRYYAEGQYNVTGAVKWLVMTDHLGSARDVVNTSGTLLYGVDFTPFGEIKRSTGSARPDLLWAGLFWDANQSIYLSYTRAYDPAAGRWLSRDTIEEEGGINLYEYVKGNPLMLVDPEGTQVAIPMSPIFELPFVRPLPPISIPVTPRFGPPPSLPGVGNPPNALPYKEHTKGKRPSSKEGHEKADARRGRDAQGEKGDKNRKHAPRKRPRTSADGPIPGYPEDDGVCKPEGA
jgi:RHS repeat-associated protein